MDSSQRKYSHDNTLLRTHRQWTFKNSVVKITPGTRSNKMGNRNPNLYGCLDILVQTGSGNFITYVYVLKR
jgi:hypothetical protein